MTSLSCGVDALLRAAQYLQFLEEQESGQKQLYQSIVLENPPFSTGMYRNETILFFSRRFASHISLYIFNSMEKTSFFIKPHTKLRAPKKRRKKR